MKLTYRRCGDYYLPNIGIPAEDMRPLGKYGRMRLRYLREHRSLLFNQLLLSGKLMKHLYSMGEATKTYDFYLDFFKDNGVAFLPSVEAATADQIMPLVMHDLGIGFVPMKFLENVKDANSVHILHLEEMIPTRSICLVKRTGTSLSIAAKKLEEMILDAKSIK